MLRFAMLFSRAGKGLLLLVAAIFLLLRFAQLQADYPRNIRWDDGISTDEGWYASAAINEQTWGTARLPGDMNIPVLMPVWSAIARVAFHVGGYGSTTLRATACLFFVLCVALMCGLLLRYGAGDWAPLLACMLAVNPWSFAFSRSAFLEFPMLSFVLLAMLLAAGSGGSSEREDGHGSGETGTPRLLLAGLAFGTALLLKTTALALAPVLLCVLILETRLQIARVVRQAATILAGAALVYGPYWLLVIRPHSADIRFYLSVVQNTLRLTLHGFVADASRPFRYGLGSDHLLFALALLAVPASLLLQKMRGLWRDPLYAISAVWLISFLGFMVKHNNDPARYYAITIPAIMLLGVALLRNHTWSSVRTRRVLLSLLFLDMAVNAVQISAAMLRPTYSFRDVTASLAAIIRNEPGQPQVLIADNAHEIALATGLKPVNLLFHSDSITQQMERYQPGWWVQFAPIEDGRCFREVLSSAYTAEWRGEWQMFYPGQRLVLWKLTKIPGTSLPATLTSAQTAACAPPVYN